MRRALASFAASAALSACTTAPVPVPVASKLPTYAEGFADGKRAMFDSLSSDPAFRVSASTLASCSDSVSWLPRDPQIDQDTWWASRQANMTLMERCRERNEAKRRAIFRMLDRVRR